MGRRKKITEADIKGEPPKPRRKRRTDYYNGTTKGAYTLIRPEKYMLRDAVVQVECPECGGTVETDSGAEGRDDGKKTLPDEIRTEGREDGLHRDLFGGMIRHRAETGGNPCQKGG